ncbi:MAG: fibronectin type III domain-containing protein [Gemmatimonadota bacterium]|nr:fibronectin type III domain-containing protein [Gemmatimonadota bacterium]
MTRRYLATAALALALLAGCSDDDDDDVINPPDTPATPSGLAAAGQEDGTIVVTWNASTGATAYVLERAVATAPTEFDAIGGDIATTTYTDDEVTPGTGYMYRVAAKNAEGTSAFSATVAASEPGDDVEIITGPITADRTLSAGTVYVLQGYVKVQPGVTLTIEPGTRIVGDFETKGSSLWILRGARIDAQGTAAAPIVFTSEQPEGSRKPGDWGGILIFGNGVSNRSGVIESEGPTGVSEQYSGGTDNTDDSGILRYVRIEFAGYDVTGTGQELNALSSYAVGNGTTYEYIQTLAGLDDSFEYWGGAVDGRYLASFESGDDHFDWTEGYRGRNQFVIAYQSTRLVPAAGTGGISSDPQGFEADGCPAGEAGCTAGNATEPFSMPVWANFTLIGAAPPAALSTSGDVGMVLRRGTGGFLTHGIVARWQRQGVSIRDAQSGAHMDNDSLMVVNILLAENGTNYDDDAGSNFAKSAAFATSNHVLAGGPVSGLLQSLTPGAGNFLQPGAGSPAASVTGAIGIPSEFTGSFFGGTLTPADYYGAVDPAGTPWFVGWTSYAPN